MVDRDGTRTRIVQRAIVPRPAKAPLSPEPIIDADPSDAEPDSDTDDPNSIDEFEKTPLGSMRVAERPDGFPTAATLADHDAAAAELRSELDELKRLLDDGPPPLSRPRRSHRRPLLGALVVGGTLAAIVTATVVPWSSLDLPGHDGGTGNGTAAKSASRSAGPAAAPARPIGAVALAPLSAPAGILPVTGPGIDVPGTSMVVQVGADGTMNVVEQAVLGPRGLREIKLALPSMASLGGAVAALHPTVRNLRVSVNGTPMNAVPTPDGSGWTVAATAGRARTVQLSYRLTDAVMRSQPSNAGRALAVSVPLLGQTLREQGLPLVVRTAGAGGTRVNEVSCPSASAREMLCGAESAAGWIATMPASATSPVLLLQLNLGS
jgi:hypothetical protein